MLIAQMTDIHIGFAPGEEPEELNHSRFRATLERLCEAPNRPDMLVLTGDITDNGDNESFDKTAALLADCPFPVWPMVGNHDSREGLLHAFPQVQAAKGGFLHYVIEQDGLRIVLLDTFEPGRHGGAFCAARQAWLMARLDEAPGTPTLVFMHHPPVVSGIDWMDPSPDLLSRGIHGIAISPVDPANPDGRDLITTEPPTYALHHWNGATLATHYESVSDWYVLARYTGKLQPMIQGMFEERE